MRVIRFARPIALVLATSATCVTTTVAQSAENPGSSGVADLAAGLSYVTLSQEVTGSVYRIESDEPEVADTRFRIFKWPWERDLDVGSDLGTLYVEAVAAWSQAEDRLAIDTSLGVATVDQDWQTYGGLVGLGWTFHLSDTWRVRPSLGGALTRLENDASFNAVGEQILAPSLDAGQVNWSSWSVTTLTSLTVLNERDVGDLHLVVRGRWSHADTNVFDSTAPSQEGRDSSSSWTVRADLSGDTPWSMAGGPIRFGTHAGYTRIVGIDVETLGFDRVAEIGGALTFPLVEDLPGVRLSGALLRGPDVSGWSLGLSLAF